MQKTIKGEYELKLFECDYCKRPGLHQDSTAPLIIELLGQKVGVAYSMYNTFKTGPNVPDDRKMFPTVMDIQGKHICVGCYDAAVTLGLETYQP